MALAAAALSATANAQLGFGRPPNPMDKAKATVVEDFVWRDPFTEETASLYTPTCEVEATFPAEQYTLHQLWDKAPRGLWSWGQGLKEFWHDKEYPGSWSGLDRHGWDRNVLLMHYDQVPSIVREWIEEQDRTDSPDNGLFAIFDKPEDQHQRVDDRVVVPKDGPMDRELDSNRVILFAPGALNVILPLFVAEASKCKDTLINLSNYSVEPADGKVVAWPIEHTRPNLKNSERKIQITIKAQALKAKAKAEESAKEEL